MLKSLKTQWLILGHSRAFVIFFLLCCICICLIPATVAFLSKDSGNSNNLYSIFEDAFIFPTVFNTVNILSKIAIIPMMSLLIIISICQELDSKTYRLHLLSGSNRGELWRNSVLVILFLSFIVSLISYLSAFCIGLFDIKNAIQTKWILICHWYVLLFIQCVGYFSWATTFALLFRKIGLVLILYITWFLLIERGVAQILNFNTVLELYPLSNMLPGKSLEGLTHLKIIEDYIHQASDYKNIQYIPAAAWCLTSNIVNYVLYRKTEY